MPYYSLPPNNEDTMQTRNLDLARAMRHHLTWAERALWRQLRNRNIAGLKFRRQQPLGCYILDFFCADKMLAVELDGGQHDAPEEREYDARRTRFLESEGVQVLRFWNSQIRANLPWVVELIRRKAGVSACHDELEEATVEDDSGSGSPHLNPLPQGARKDVNQRFDTPWSG